MYYSKLTVNLYKKFDCIFMNINIERESMKENKYL